MLTSRYHNEHDDHNVVGVAAHSSSNKMAAADHTSTAFDAPPTQALHQRQQSMAPELVNGTATSAAKPRPQTAAKPTGIVTPLTPLMYQSFFDGDMMIGWRKRMGGGARIISHVFNAQNYTRKEVSGDDLVSDRQ
jgi:hypothetical protein